MLKTVRDKQYLPPGSHEETQLVSGIAMGLEDALDAVNARNQQCFFARTIAHRNGREEGERPFWISFADLMTALMVLFLVSLSVALNDANKQRDEAVKAQVELRKEREELARAKAEL